MARRTLGRSTRIGKTGKPLGVFDFEVGKFDFLVSIAGPKGGGRFVLKADNPAQAAAKAGARRFGLRGGQNLVGTEVIVTRKTKNVTDKAQQTFFEVQSRVVNRATGLVVKAPFSRQAFLKAKKVLGR